jgi:cytochrome c oxidase subunit 2
VLILIGLAWPATRILVYENNTSNSVLTVKVTGVQWKWVYDYIDYQGQPVDNVGFISSLAADSNDARQMDSGISPWSIKSKHGVDDYLLDVNHPLVVPTHTKIQFLITAADVIHGFWVPALGWQADAIPGQIHDAWGQLDKPGTYRGQCAQLCGQDHAYMPIVIKAVPRAEFKQWLAAQENKSRMQDVSRTAQVAADPGAVPQG